MVVKRTEEILPCGREDLMEAERFMSKEHFLLWHQLTEQERELVKVGVIAFMNRDKD